MKSIKCKIVQRTTGNNLVKPNHWFKNKAEAIKWLADEMVRRAKTQYDFIEEE